MVEEGEAKGVSESVPAEVGQFDADGYCLPQNRALETCHLFDPVDQRPHLSRVRHIPDERPRIRIRRMENETVGDGRKHGGIEISGPRDARTNETCLRRRST